MEAEADWDQLRTPETYVGYERSAAATNEVISQFGSFDAYLRSFDDPEKEIQDLQHRFAGFGDCSAWWFMQSVRLPVPPTE